MSDSKVESEEEHRARLQPVLDELDAMGKSTFLDLCELVIMLSERVNGSIKMDHPRVLVHIKQRKRSTKK